MSHLDVVEGADEQFQPVEKNGCLYGRGSIDDKYAVALSLVLLKNRLQQCRRAGGGQANLTFGVLITGDEEVGGANGARRVLPEIQAEFCIALDGGRPEKIVVKEKGILHLKLIARGRTAHAARPWLGSNAIENLIADYRRIQTFFVSPSPPDPDHWHRTLNFSTVQAGKSLNQVPDRAEACFDVRFTENDAPDAIVADIRSVIEGELVVETVEPLFFSRPSPYLERIRAVAPEAVFGAEHGASDARYLSEYGMNGVVWGAEGNLSQHSTEEHVVIESIERLYRMMDRLVDFRLT
jgi:succinyl-diaminopimelate desuccinylase